MDLDYWKRERVLRLSILTREQHQVTDMVVGKFDHYVINDQERTLILVEFWTRDWTNQDVC